MLLLLVYVLFSFHCDEALACAMLHMLPTYRSYDIVRTRNEAILKDVAMNIDVGGVYDPANHRYDHHQRGFAETLSPAHTMKLSSAGLVYKHFGRDIIRTLTALDEEQVNVLYEYIYKSFVEAIDGTNTQSYISHGHFYSPFRPCSDVASSGNIFYADASPSLTQLILAVTKAVPYNVTHNLSLYDVWSKQTQTAGATIGTLGSGSDFSPFLQHLGIASCDFGFTFAGPSGSYPVYHSIYDSYQWISTFGDPEFRNSVVMVKVLGNKHSPCTLATLYIHRTLAHISSLSAMLYLCSCVHQRF